MSAQQRYEDVDEFEPATAGIEEGTYKVKYLRCIGRVSGTYGDQNVHEFAFVDLPDETIRYYTPCKSSKGSKQRAMIEAFLGREMDEMANDGAGEVVTPRDLKGKIADAFVEMNARGYPAIKGLSRVRKPAARRAPAPVPADDDNPFEPDEE